MITDIDYHMERSRSERALAYQTGTGAVADAHMALSELHLHRAMALQHVQHAPLGNVTPLRPARGRDPELELSNRSMVPAA